MKNKHEQGNLWFGLLFAAVGAFIMLVAIDVIHSPDENFHAPRWVVLVAGLTFFVAGVYVSLIDPRFEAMQDSWWFQIILKTVQLAVPLSLLIVFNWVAFGGGERKFSSSVSIPFLTISTENSNQLMGRCVFGSVAVLSDLVLVVILFNSAKKWISGRDEND